MRGRFLHILNPKNIAILSAAQRKYRDLYEESPDLYRTINTDGIILNCNRSYAEHLGYSKDDLIGTSIFDTTAEESLDAMRQSFEAWKKTGQVLNREVWLKRKDGTTFPALISATSLFDEDGKLIGSNTIIKDISEMYKIRKELEDLTIRLKKQAEKLREIDIAKEEFSSMVTHELKTPLVPIQGYCEMLLKGMLGELSEKQKEKIQIIYRNATRLLHLIQDILDAHKLEMGKMKFDMSDASAQVMIEQCISAFKPLADSKKVALVDGTNAALMLKCDERRILQVLNNLVSNALKFVPEQGGIVVISATKHNSSVMFSVRDNGIGIPKEKHQNLFRKFYQLDTSLRRTANGTGLGLAISKAIVEAHKGNMWLESEKEKGATFYFSIPQEESQ
jgi:PAS domain S-box-containing protein